MLLGSFRVMPEIGAFPDLRFRGALSNAYFPQQDLSCAIKLCVGHIFQLRAHPAKIQARFHCGAQQIVTCKLTYVLSTQMTKHQEMERHAADARISLCSSRLSKIDDD